MSSSSISSAFICPISQDIMRDPVMLFETGTTYERIEIIKWLSNHDTDPLTNEILKNKLDFGILLLLGKMYFHICKYKQSILSLKLAI